jgi:hypothetical protein
VRKKALIWFISLFTVLLAFGVGHRPLICFGAKSYLSTRLPRGGSLNFSYDHARLNEGQLVLHDVTVVRKEGKGSPAFNVKIDDLKVSFKLQMFPFRFSPKVIMDHPQVALMVGGFKEPKKKKGVYDILDKLFFRTPVKVQAGEFVFGDQVAEVTFECPEEEKKGFLKISKGGGETPFIATFLKEEKQLHFDLNFERLDTVWAFEIGRFFLPSLQNDMEVKNGELSGTVELALSAPKQIEYVKYSLGLKEFAFSHQQYGLDVSLHHLTWKEHFTSNTEMKGWESHPFFENLWPYFVGEGEVAGLHARLDHPKNDEVWGAVDVNGSLRFSRLNAPLMEFHGLFHRKGKEVPFHLVGEGIIEDNTTWKVACDARFFDKEEIGAFVALTSKGGGIFIVEGEGKSLAPDQLTLFQHFVGAHIPAVEKITIDQGTFDGKVIGWIENKKLTRCEMTDFKATQVVGSVYGKDLHWKGNEVFGKGEFDFSSPDFFDGTHWEVKVVGGECNIQERKIEGIDLLVAMHDQYLKPSTLTCSYEGINGKFAFEGLYSHLNINVDILLHPERLAELLQVQKPKNMSEPVALDLDMKLKTVDGRLGVEGSLGFLREGEKDDIIEFGWNWDLERFVFGEYLSSLELGWFHAEKISARTLNLPLMIWHRDFRGRGSLGLEGTFNSRAVEFSIDPTDLKYESKAIDIMPKGEGEEKAPNCNFFLDFEKGIWRGKIPLKNAQVQEHSFGLLFDSFTSEVDLEGTEFLFQNVDAVAEGVHFQAEIAVDFARADRNELTINTYAIEGEGKDILTFLNHFESFRGVEIPLSGAIKSGPGDMHLHAYIGDIEELLEWRIALQLRDGQYPFSESFGFENLSGNLYYSAEDERFKIEDVAGDLTLTAGNIPKSYSLNVPVLELDAKEGILIYDCRLEAPTYEICRVVGRGAQEGEEFCFHIDTGRTRFFGARMEVETLAFHEGFLSRASVATKLSALDLVHHLDFLNSAGLLPIKEETLDEMRGPHVAGELEFGFLFNRKEEAFSFDAKSSSLRMGSINLDHLLVHGQRQGDRFTLDRFEAGSLKIHATMVREEARWHLPDLEVLWKKCFLKSGVVTFDEEKRQLQVPLEGLRLDLEEIATLFPHTEFEWDYLNGILFAKGGFTFDFSRGWKDWAFDSELYCVGEEFGRGRFRVESPEALRVSYNPQDGFSLNQADFNFLHPRSNQLWAKCHFDRLGYRDGTLKGEGAKFIVPPEMVHFIGQTHSLPHLGYEEERMIVFDYPIEWENQIEASLDFELGETSKASGYLKEGYYWVGDKAWYLSSCSFGYEKETLTVNVNTLYDELPFDLKADLSFHPHFTSRFVIQETCNDQRGEQPLVIQTDWNKNEGFFIQSMDGGVCGLDFSFHHNPKESFLDKMALTGQLKVNVPKLAQLMPEEIRNTVSEFEIGKGYELSGDLIISKTQFDESHFSGYLKGKKFQLMGSLMGTLMSEIDIRPDHIELDHFTISDSSGMFAIESIRMIKNSNEEWELNIPEVVITDFRPSLLKKIGKYPTRIKPLTIRELRANNIRGTLGNASSFVGKGNLNFINTFKRDYHILDIPFEILGRLGLDMGLLVPVRGEIEYVIVDGRVYFTELKSSYSEGKRSQFYLSPIEHSYIDFDGNINVNIKMKQYVLLKVTEPFTLSIGGTFENPKYGLR